MTNIDFKLPKKELNLIAKKIKENGKIVKINAKHRLPTKQVLSMFKKHKIKFHLGSDVESLDKMIIQKLKSS